MKGSRFKPLVIIQSYEDRNSGKETVVVQQTINERLSSLNQRETSQEKASTPVSRKGSNASVSSPPPPPPFPLPEIDEVDNAISPVQLKQKTKAPPPPVPQKIISFPNQPPPCPTPDYDTLSITSTSTLPRKLPVNGFLKKELKHTNSHNGFGTPPEAESPNQQNGFTPKFSNRYFKATSSPVSPVLQNGVGSNSTLTKQRPVSVIIGEYPSGTSRKQPKKLEFLNGTREGGGRSPQNDSISSQFASELAQTLSRSNLRKRTESMENLLNHPQIKANSNGSVRISVSSNLLNRHLAKSTNDLSSLDAQFFNNNCNGKVVSNRVTISIPSNERKSFEASPSGILKNHGTINGNNIGGTHTSPSSLRSVLHQKSITFGEIPTVINDKPLRVT